MEHEYHTPAEAFVGTCVGLRMAEVVSPRGMTTTEWLNATLVINDPTQIPFDVEGRQLNLSIAALEVLQLLGQQPADALVRRTVRALAAYQDAGISYGNYGARLRGQLTNVVKELVDDPASRRAVVSIYDGSRDLRQQTRDVPCTLTAQFFIRDDSLHTRVSMQSNDAWLGLPYDLHQFCALHCAMAEVMELTPGPYTHTVGSLHLYEQHWNSTWELGATISSPQRNLFALLDEDVSYEPLKRLTLLVQLCQDIMDGTGDPITPFEQWLVQAVHDER